MHFKFQAHAFSVSGAARSKITGEMSMRWLTACSPQNRKKILVLKCCVHLRRQKTHSKIEPRNARNPGPGNLVSAVDDEISRNNEAI